jgi:hypothetical protein
MTLPPLNSAKVVKIVMSPNFRPNFRPLRHKLSALFGPPTPPATDMSSAWRHMSSANNPPSFHPFGSAPTMILFQCMHFQSLPRI